MRVTGARRGKLTRADIAADLGISIELENRWVRKTEVDESP